MEINFHDIRYDFVLHCSTENTYNISHQRATFVSHIGILSNLTIMIELR